MVVGMVPTSVTAQLNGEVEEEAVPAAVNHETIGNIPPPINTTRAVYVDNDYICEAEPSNPEQLQPEGNSPTNANHNGTGNS